MTHNTSDAVTDLLDAARITAVVPCPDGRILATVQQLNRKGTGYVTQVHDLTGDISDTSDATPLSEIPTRSTQLTRSDESVSAVQPVPGLDTDGRVYFLSARPGNETDPHASDVTEKDTGASLWVLPERGEAIRLGTRPWGFDGLQASRTRVVAQLRVHSHATDETQHAELVEQRSTAAISGILYSGYPTRYWDHDLPPGRSVLGIADLPQRPDDSVDFTWVELPTGRLLSWDLSRDGSIVVATLEQNTSELLDATVVVRIDLPSGQVTELVRAAEGHSVDSGQISPDGTQALLTSAVNWTPQTNLQVATDVLDLNSGHRTRLWPGLDRWVTPVWVTDHRLAATSDDLGAGAIWLGTDDDEVPARLTAAVDTYTGSADQLAAARHWSGLVTLPEQHTDDAALRLYALADGISLAPHPVLVSVTGTAAEPVSQATSTALVNPATALNSPGTLHTITANAHDGTTVRAWLRVPESEGPHPLLVFVHGGPWGSWNGWTYRWNPDPFVAAGYAVLLPDPAISTGYGQQMIDRGQQQLGGTPYTDLLALHDAALALPEIDQTRTALAGGSYGGYMANWMAGQTGHRFACIVTHASLWETTSMGRTTDNAEWDRAMTAQAAQYSPHQFAENIDVPMLVIHGNQDHRVPIGQALDLWHALHTRAPQNLDANGHTRHRYLYYPDEGHWIQTRGNAEVWYRTVLAFIDQHVRGTRAQYPSVLG